MGKEGEDREMTEGGREVAGTVERARDRVREGGRW